MEWKETQIVTASQLRNESEPVEEIHFTPRHTVLPKNHAYMYILRVLGYSVRDQLKKDENLSSQTFPVSIYCGRSGSFTCFLVWNSGYSTFGLIVQLLAHLCSIEFPHLRWSTAKVKTCLQHNFCHYLKLWVTCTHR